MWGTTGGKGNGVERSEAWMCVPCLKQLRLIDGLLPFSRAHFKYLLVHSQHGNINFAPRAHDAEAHLQIFDGNDGAVLQPLGLVHLASATCHKNLE